MLTDLLTHLPGVSGLLAGVVGHLGGEALKLYHERKQSQLSADAEGTTALTASYSALTPSLIVHAAFAALMVGLTVWAYQAGWDDDLRKALTEWTGMLVAWMAGRLLTK